MIDQKRDESRDIGIIWGDFETPQNCSCHISPPCEACVNNREQPSDVLRWEDCDAEERYVPHSDLVATEERASLAEDDLDALKKSIRHTMAALDSELYPDEDMGRQNLGYARRKSKRALSALEELCE